MRFATIGTSLIAEQFVAGAKLSGVWEHAAVYSRTRETGLAFCEKTGCTGAVYTSLDELAAADIDAVYVASPNVCHYEQSKFLLAHGKHVLCEKPITVTAAQYRELRTLAAQNGLVYMEAIMSRHTQNRRTLHDAVARIGNISTARLDFCQLSSRYAAYRRGENPNIFNPALCGGALKDLGIYCVWAAVDLFGRPERITATASFGENGIDLAGCAVFTYPAFSAVLTYAKNGQSRIGSEIVGDNGTVNMRLISMYADITEHAVNGETVFHPSADKVTVMSEEAKHFADCIQTPNTAEYTVLCDQTQTVLDCMDAIARAAGITD
ncbi:MAG: Gfo/Idh/MocA family oxidoreductase [Clostridia bacterium]|nr:Gfo/Idh/MocA family oxidoreductase [Clostridia bacterium]